MWGKQKILVVWVVVGVVVVVVGGYWMMRMWQGATIQIFLNNHLQQRVSLYFQILKRYCYIGFINKLNKLYFINV